MDISAWSSGPFVFKGERVDFIGEARLESFEEPVNLLAGWQKNINWWIGDLFLEGERVHGDDIWNHVPQGLDIKLIETCMFVSREVPKEVRRSDVSWECHREVVRLDIEVQRTCLSVCAVKGWDNLQLREYTRRWRKASSRGLIV